MKPAHAYLIAASFALSGCGSALKFKDEPMAPDGIPAVNDGLISDATFALKDLNKTLLELEHRLYQNLTSQHPIGSDAAPLVTTIEKTGATCEYANERVSCLQEFKIIDHKRGIGKIPISGVSTFRFLTTVSMEEGRIKLLETTVHVDRHPAGIGRHRAVIKAK